MDVGVKGQALVVRVCSVPRLGGVGQGVEMFHTVRNLYITRNVRLKTIRSIKG